MKKKIYTRRGDDGKTDTLFYGRVKKNDKIVEFYGTIDELNAFLGLAKVKSKEKKIKNIIENIQKKLFSVPLFEIKEEDVEQIERYIDEIDSKLEELNEFIIPGKKEEGTYIHVARTVCRRAERVLVSLEEEKAKMSMKFLNRLSDLLFVLARYVDERH